MNTSATSPAQRTHRASASHRAWSLRVTGAGIAAALSLLPASHAADPTPARAAKPALSVQVVTPQSTQWPLQLWANGSIAPWQEASVGAEVSGLRVQELKAQVGDQVRQGQVLATFAAESVQADVALARAALSEASANAAEARANADRARAVQSSGALSAQQVQQYLTAELAAQARQASAQAQLDAQLLRLKNTVVRAPDDGVISARSASIGAVLGAGTEMFKLIRRGRLQWRAEVTAPELARLKRGTTVSLTAPSGAQAQGRISIIAPTVDSATRMGLVYVDLLKSSAAFKPGMFVRGAFELGASTAVTLPQSAVVLRDGFSYAYSVLPNNRVRQLKVQTGRTVGDRIEVLQGVQTADRIVASGANFLSDGDSVHVVGTATAPTSSSASASASSPASAAQR